MTVPFKNIPANIRVPLFYAEVDNSRANTAQPAGRTLIIGQITSAGSAAANLPALNQGTDDAIRFGGPGSVLAVMVAAYRKNDPLGEVWCLPIADDSGATAALATFQFTAAATTAGTLYLYVAGVRYALPVSTTQTTAQLATALAALVNADTSAFVTAAPSTSTVTFTAKNKGPLSTPIYLIVNFMGAAQGEVTPAGLTYAIGYTAGSATSPSLAAGLAALGDMTFDVIVSPYYDIVTLNALRDFLNDATGRWSYLSQTYGHVFTCGNGTLGTMTTLGAGRNNQHETIVGVFGNAEPPWVWAAAFAGAAASSLRNDPAVPLQTVAVQGLLPPAVPNRYVLSERNTLLYNGISTFTVGDDGVVRIENLITTYQKNAFGAVDNSYLEVETMFTLAFVLRFMKAAVTSKFSRAKLAADGIRTTDPNVVTPSVIRAEVIAKYRELESLGLVQNGDEFKAGLVVEKNVSNPNRVDVLWPGTLINQLRVFALLAQFRLS